MITPHTTHTRKVVLGLTLLVICGLALIASRGTIASQMAERIAASPAARQAAAKIPAPVRKAVASRLSSHAATVLLNDFTKTAIPAPSSNVAAGTTITYILRIRNNDLRPDTGPRIVDPFPAGTSFVSYAINAQPSFPFTCDVATNPGSLTCYVAPFAGATAIFGAGESFEVQYTLRVNPNAPTGNLYSNPANYQSNSGGATPPVLGQPENLNSNNNGGITHNIVRVHDMGIVKSSVPDALSAGGLINYTLAVTNHGPSTLPAQAANVNDYILTKPVTLQGTINGPEFGGTCNGGTNFSNCFNQNPIEPGQTLFINYQVKVNANFSPVPGVLSNTAAVEVTSGTNPNSANDTSVKNVVISNALADLRIKKFADPQMLIAGDPNSRVTYSIDFFNNGPANASNVRVTDTVPANLGGSPITIFAPDWDCHGFTLTPGGHFTCNFTANGGVLPAGQGSTNQGGTRDPIYFQASVPANIAPGTIISNQALIQSPQADPNSANNLSLATSTIVKTKADLSIAKTDSQSGNGPDPVVAGQNVVYRIRVNGNPGPSDARDVVWTDVMDLNTTFVSLTGPNGGALPGGWDCTAPAQGTSGVISCSRALLPAGAANQDFFLTVRVKPDFAGNTVSNVSRIRASTTDDTLNNNTEGEQTTVNRQVNLTIAKTGAPSTVVAGDNVTYTIQVGNSGPSTALGVSVTDALPANTSFVSAGGTGVFGSGGGGCTFAAGTVTCVPANGELAPGAAETITIVAKTNPGYAGPIGPNKAVVTSNNPAAMQMSNEVTVNAIIRTDLSIKKEDSPDAVTAGQEIFYTIRVTNNGPSDAPAGSITLNDATPANTTYVNGSLDTSLAPGFSCTANPLACTNSAGALLAGQIATIKFKVLVNANAPTGFITNMATVSSANDTNSTNNTSMTQTAVGPNADLQLTKLATTSLGAAQGAAVTAGGPSAGPIATAYGAIDYTLSYKNNGPSAASNVVVSDVIPGNSILVGSITSAGPVGNCQVVPAGAGNQIRCTAASLNSGDQGTISFRVRVPAGAPQGAVIKNQALITADTPDSNTSSNTSNETQNVVRTAADLAIYKLAPATVVAGNTITYTLSVANNVTALGGSDAKDVVVTDVLPAGVLFNSVSAGPEFACTAPTVGTNGSVTCTRANLPAGATSQITIVGTVDPALASSPLINHSTIESSTFDPNSGDNTSDASTVVTRQVALTIAKTAAPSPVVAGTNLTYTITVGNSGPSAALGVSVTDPLPANTSFVSAAGTGLFAGSNGGGCTFAAGAPVGTVTCTPANGTLPPNSSETITIVVKVAANAPSPVGPNVATVTSTNPATSTSSQPVNVPVTRQVDMTIAKDDSPDAVQAGQDITYTLTVTNNGPSEAPLGKVTVNDTVPANTTIVGAPDVSLAPGFTCNTSVVCTNSTAAMPPGAQAIIRFTVKVNAGFGTGAINNVATVEAKDGATNLDPNTNNNTASETTSVGPFADLQLTKTSAPASATAGGPAPGTGQINYTITYRNNGPSDATGVQITDTIQANLAAVGTINAPGLSCHGLTATPGAQFVCTPNAGAFGSNAAGVLPNGAQGTITFSVRVPANVAQGALIANAALIASAGSASTPATPDPNTANNSQNATSTLVNTVADMQIVKTQSASTIVAGGGAINYTLAVTNAGPSDAQNVVVNDSLPAGLEFVAVSQTVGSGFTCTNPGVGQNGVVSCSKGVMAAGEMATFVITVQAPSGAAAATRTNTATVQSSTSEVPANNNSSSVTTQIVTDANVTITKIDNPDPVIAGENLTYTITVTNSGPSTARNVSVSDTIPTNTTFVSLAGSGILANCSHNAGAVSCTPGTLANGESATLTLVVKVNPSAPAGANAISNTATVNWTDSDSNPGTQTVTAQTTVNRGTDLTIKKSDSPQAVLAGNNIVYTIKVRNNGPSTAAIGGAIVRDATPANTTDVSLAGGGPFAGCTLAALHGAGCANSSAMNPGDEATLTYTVQVVPGTPTGFITNTATVEASPAGNDPNTTNNSSTTQTAVGPHADLQLTKTASPASVVAGGPAPGSGQITYTINYRNNGPSDAIGVSITDTVSANLLTIPGVTIAAAGLSCNGASPVPGVQFSCTPNASAFGSNPAGVLPVGSSGIITYSVRVPASVAQGTLIANSALITSLGSGSTPATPDPNTSNNSQNATSTLVNTTANLAVAKTGSPDTVKAGDNINYSISVANNGPSDARNVVLTDAVPAGATFVSFTAPANWNCTAPTPGSTGTISCATATLAAGAPAQSFALVVRVNPGFGGNLITNTATAASSTPEPSPDPNPNSASATTNVQSMSAVAVTKQVTGLPPGSQPPTVAAGNYVSYTIGVSNSGPSDAILTAAGLADTIPANTTFVSFSGTGILGGNACSFAGSTLTCLPGGVVPAGATAAANNVTLVVRVNANAPVGTLTNTATANVSTSNTGGQTPSSSASVNVVRGVDLSIAKKAPGFVRSGDTFSYTLTVTNHGPSEIPATAGGVTVSDTLPSQVTYLGSSASGAGNFTGSHSAGVVTFSNNAAIQVGGVATLVINVRVNSGVAVNTQITNTATVSETLADTSDPVSDNNSATAVSTTTTGADLELSKTADRNSVESGGGAATGRITYTIKIANNGPSTSNSVQVTDNVPAFANLIGSVSFSGTSFVPQTGPPAPAPPAGICSVDAGGKITCNVTSNGGALLIGQGATINYTVEIPAGVPVGTVITNVANVASIGANATADPNPPNNSDSTNTVVSFGADLIVEKTAVPADGSGVIAGQFIDYTLTVRNDGPSDAQNVVLIDTLSDDGSPNANSVKSTFISLDASAAPGFTCSTPSVGGTGSITCRRVILPLTTAATAPKIKFRVLVDPSATAGNVDNRVSVSSSTADSDLLDNSDSTSHPVSAFSTLALVKSAQPNPVVAGQNLTYTLSVTNNGASDALNVVLVDTIPAYTSLVSFSGAGVFTAAGTCAFNNATKTLQCSPNAGPPFAAPSGTPPTGGTLPRGATGTITLVVKVDANIPVSTVGPNSFTVTSTTPGASGTSNGVTVNVIRRADLEIRKTAPASGIAGEVIDYTLTVKNNGPSGAPAGVVVTDPLPAGTTFVSLNQTGAPSFGLCTTPAVGSGGTVSCVSDKLMSVGATETIIIKVRISAGVQDSTNIVNCATVTAPDPPTGDAGPIDPIAGNNQSCAATVVRTSADLGVAKTGSVSGTAGKTITYTINFGNAGPSDAVNVRITDPIPNNTTLQTAAPFTVQANDSNPATPAINVVCSVGAGQLLCTPTGNGPAYADGVLPAGYTGSFQFVTQVNASVASGTLITNQVNITSAPGGTTPATPDPNPGNNTAVATNTLVNTSADLTITKSATPTATAGGNVTYTVTVANASGPSDAQNVLVSDPLPAGTTFVSVSSSDAGFFCSPPTAGTNGTVMCSKPTLAVGQSATITIVARINSNVASGTVLSNTATVASSTPDPNAPNTATATTTVSTQSSVAVTKQVTGLPPASQPPTVAAGNYVSYTIGVSNNGPSDAILTAAGLADTIPANTTFVSFSGTGILGGNACNFAGSTLTCLPGGVVPAGATAAANNVTLVVRVNANAPVGTLTNTATANVSTSNTGGQTPSSSASVNVVRGVDLSIAKKAPGFVRSGDTFSYTLTVTNHGPSEIPASAGGVTVSDTLPSQVTFLGSSASGAGNFTGSHSAGVVTFSNNAAIQVGGVATLVINVRVNSGVAVNTQITNVATVAENLADTSDPVTDNNSAGAVSTTTTGADLELSKTADRNSVESGGGAATGRIAYTIKIANNGPSTSNSVQVTDNVPAFANLVGTVSFSGTSFVPQTGPPAPAVPSGSCSVDAGGKITCNVTSNGGALLIGQGATIAYTVEVPAGVPVGTVIANLANVSSVGANATADPNPANNSDSTNTVVSFGADLSVEKTAVPADGSGVIAGQFIDYTLTVRNDGPSDAQNVVVIDTLSQTGSPNATSVRSTFVSLDASGAPGFTCSVPSVGGTGSVSCSRAILPRTGANPAVIRIRVLVDPSATTGAVDNRAIVTSSTADPDLLDNSDTTAHPVSTFSTLALVKSAQPNPVVAGQNLTYTLSVTNNGVSDALNVVLKDTIPAYTSLVSFSGSGVFTAAGTCSFDNATGMLQCSPNAGPPFAAPSGTPPTGGTLPRGATGTITLVVKVDANIPVNTVGPNSFTVTSTTPGASGTSNGVTVNVIRRADLEIRKTAPSSGIAGEVIDYTLTVRNNGPSGAPAGVVATDVLPPGVTFVSLNQTGAPSFGPCTTPAVGANGTVSCTTNVLMPVGAVETIIIKVRIRASAQDNTNIVNCATVTAPEPPTGDAGPIDPIPGNNQSCAATVVRTSADLGVTKSGATSGTAGTPITYTINYGNAGPSDAVNVRITDPIPNNTTLQTATPFSIQANDNNPATPAINVVCRLIAGQIVCTPEGNGPAYADGVLPAGYVGSFQLTALINPSVAGGTLIVNQVNITSAPGGTTPATPDPNAGNNTAVAVNTVVIANSQLSISKVISSATFAQSPPAAAGAVVPGTQMTYRITVTNNGPSDVANLRVLDTIPSNVRYVAINQSGGFGTTFTCQAPTGIVDPSGNGGIVQCTAPLMSATAPNNTATIDLTVFIDPSTKASIVNKADVNATTNGFNQPVSSTFTLTTPVGPTSDLVLTKTHTPEPVIAGNNLTYTLTLRNNGPSTAAMVNLVDTLPQFQSLAAPADVSGAPGFTCTPNTVGTTGAITCTAASMLPNTQAVIKLTVKVDPSAPAGTYNNVATASSMSFDPTPATVTDPVTVITRSDLSITKAAPSTVIAGTQMTYTINATNNGPSSASNMMITDVLPTGTVFISASAPGSTTLTTPAVSSNGTVKATWSGLTLPGVTRSLTIVVRVCSEVACDTNLVNTATTTSDTTDPDTTNNSATATTKVQVQWDLSIAKNGPATVAPDGNATYTLTVSNSGPSVATNVVVTDILPKGFTVVGSPTATIAGAGIAVTTNPANGQQTVTANLGSVGADNQCSTSLPKVVTITIVTKVAKTMPFITVTNLASLVSSPNCAGGNQGDQNAANNSTSFITKIVNGGPEVGLAFPADSEISDQKAGSVLIYPIYTSDAASPNRENTRITITNTHGMEKACIHLFGIDGATCAVADAYVCLTPNQTTSFLASDLDPGNRGYFIAIAVDCETGLPKAHNYLIGDSYVKFASGHQANLAAESIAATMWNPAGADTTQRFATLNFDGMSYNRLPTILGLDNIPSPADSNNTMVIVNRIGGDLSNSAATIGPLFGFVFNDQEVGFSFTATVGACQLRQTLSNSFPRLLTPFGAVIPAGRTGWMKFWSNNEYGLVGASINFNPNAAANSGSFNQGHNLHKLRLAPNATLTIPVVVPFC